MAQVILPYLAEFGLQVLAGVVAYLICKALDKLL